MTPSKPAAHLSGLEKALVLPAVPNDRLGALRRLAQRIGWEIDNNEAVGGRAVAVLAVQLRLTLAEMAELAPSSDESALDEVLARRAERERRGEAVPVNHAASTRGGRSHG